MRIQAKLPIKTISTTCFIVNKSPLGKFEEKSTQKAWTK